jgi:ketosteroid isomerase-like protein
MSSFREYDKEEVSMIGALIAKRKVRDAFSSFNERDIPKFLASWADDAVFIYPGDVSVSGTVKGRTAIEAWFTHLMDAGPSVHFTLKSVTLENIFDVVGTNVMCAEWENAVTSRAGAKVVVHGVSVIRLRRGKITRVRDYIFDTGKLPVVWCETGEPLQGTS